jgi:DDE superfamily endonuclease
VAVSLSIANSHASLPVAYRLYLPREWIKDRKRRSKAGVPSEIRFKTKPAIALDQIRWACDVGMPRGAVLMDAGYGSDTDLRSLGAHAAQRQSAAGTVKFCDAVRLDDLGAFSGGKAKNDFGLKPTRRADSCRCNIRQLAREARI